MSQKKRSRKDRTHSGWVYPRSTLKCTKQHLLDNCLDPQPFWDDWIDVRDGFRDGLRDGKMIKRVGHKLCLPPESPRTISEAVLIKLFGEDEEVCEFCQNRRNWNSKQKKFLERRKLMKPKALYR